jgi:hypothetical protein
LIRPTEGRVFFAPWRRCASLPMAPHRHAKRAWPRHKIIPVKWFNLVGRHRIAMRSAPRHDTKSSRSNGSIRSESALAVTTGQKKAPPKRG